MESNEQQQITVNKAFEVPVEDLYQAWTEGSQLKQWWKPLGMTLTDVQNELSEGGKIAYRFEGADSQGLTIDGSYQEVKPQERLVYTWNWQFPDEKLNSAYKLEVVFKSSGTGSSIEIAQQQNEQQESVKPKASAWEEELTHLAEFLSSGKSSSNSNDASSTAMDQEGKPDYGSQNPLQDQQ
jgi:uncharacterized protein YndB with AHSA1/START domain